MLEYAKIKYSMSPQEFQYVQELIGTREQMAKALGVTLRTIGRYKSGESEIPKTVWMACRLIKYMIEFADVFAAQLGLGRDDFLKHVITLDIPAMTKEQFTSWMEENHLSYNQTGDILDKDTRTVTLYGHGELGIPKPVQLAILFLQIRIPSILNFPAKF